jgi:hypothetical protein
MTCCSRSATGTAPSSGLPSRPGWRPGSERPARPSAERLRAQSHPYRAGVDHSALEIHDDPAVWTNVETGERSTSVVVSGPKDLRWRATSVLYDKGLSNAPYPEYDMWSRPGGGVRAAEPRREAEAGAAEVDVLAPDRAAALVSACVVQVSPARRGLHDRVVAVDQALTLEAVERGVPAALLAVVVDIDHVRARGAGGDRHVAVRVTAPPVADLPLVGRRVKEPVGRRRLLGAWLAREHRPARPGIGQGNVLRALRLARAAHGVLPMGRLQPDVTGLAGDRTRRPQPRGALRRSAGTGCASPARSTACPTSPVRPSSPLPCWPSSTAATRPPSCSTGGSPQTTWPGSCSESAPAKNPPP